MSRFPIVFQTITWGAGQKDMFPEVFAAVARAGYTGVEIGFRHIREIPPADLVKMLNAEGLELTASHMGGNLFDPAQASQERGILEEVIEYLGETGTKLLMYSGLRYESDEQLGKGVSMLNIGAQMCASCGIELLYHNHAFEFENSSKVIDALLKDGCEALGWCPDIGWVMKGGEDAVAFLEKIKGKLGAVHFKDFATSGPGCDTVILGNGIAPLAEAAGWVKANAPGLPVIAEQDNADVPAAEAAAANAAYLKSQFQ